MAPARRDPEGRARAVAIVVAEPVLFADSNAIEEFAGRLAGPDFASPNALLPEGGAQERLRGVQPRFAIPATLGASPCIFPRAERASRLHEIDATDEERTREFSDHTAETTLFGSARSREGSA